MLNGIVFVITLAVVLQTLWLIGLLKRIERRERGQK